MRQAGFLCAFGQIAVRVATSGIWLDDRREVQNPNLLLALLADTAPSNVRGNLLEEILFGFVDFVALGASGERDFFVQLLDVRRADVRDLLQHLQDVGELWPENFVRRHTQRVEGGLFDGRSRES